MTLKTHPLFEKAKSQMKTWVKNELDLIATLREIERNRIYKLLDFRSMHALCTEGLGLTDSQAYTLIGVSRKCDELPELKGAIDAGRFSPAKARKMLSVITKDNSEEWIEKAEKLTERQLEREVAKVRPQALILDKIKPMAANLNKFECGIDDETEELLNACRDLISKRLGKVVHWNEALKILGKEYKERRDPVEKAKRAQGRQPKLLFPGTVNPRFIPAKLKHEIAMRDQGECQHLGLRGRCRSRSFTEIHHIKPVALGGANTLDNLITLCGFHHDMQHGFESKKYARPGVSEDLIRWPIRFAS